MVGKWTKWSHGRQGAVRTPTLPPPNLGKNDRLPQLRSAAVFWRFILVSANDLCGEMGLSSDCRSVQTQGLPRRVRLRSGFQSRERLDGHTRASRYIRERQTSS